MMARENEKRIVIRIEPELWQKLDDKRHAQRSTFQELGMYLFQEWLTGEKSAKSEGNSSELRDKVNVSSGETGQLVPEQERPWVEALIKILQSKNDIASHALKSNIVAFSDYVIVAPEVSDGFAEISADEKRLAALDERMVDAGKTVKVGGHSGSSKAGKKASK